MWNFTMTFLIWHICEQNMISSGNAECNFYSSMTGCWKVSVTGIELVRGQEVKKLKS